MFHGVWILAYDFFSLHWIVSENFLWKIINYEYAEYVSYCFHSLQKLRAVHSTYLVGIINGLQQKVKTLESQLNAQSGVTPAPSTPPTGRVNNLM